MKKLTDAAIRNAAPRDRIYTLPAGDGLHVIVHPTGKKYFQFRYTFLKRPRLMQLGPCSKLTLEQARKKVREHRDQLTAEEDPITFRRASKITRAAEVAGTFAATADAWLARNKSAWSQRNYQRHAALLKLWLLPQLGALPVTKITVTMCLAVLREPEAQGKLQTAHQALTTLGMILDYAVDIGALQVNPVPRHRALKPRPKTKHHPALQLDEVGPCLRALEASRWSPVTKGGVRLALLLGLRDTTLRSATWREIDWDSALWACPEEHMKGRVTHKRAYSTPLSPQALAVLKHLHAITYRGDESLILPNQDDSQKQMSSVTLNDALRRLGFAATIHGMRATMNTHLSECGFRREVREAQLAHVNGSLIAQAYERTDFWDARVVMMRYWGSVVEALEAGDPLPQLEDNNVHRLQKRA